MKHIITVRVIACKIGMIFDFNKFN